MTGDDRVGDGRRAHGAAVVVVRPGGARSSSGRGRERRGRKPLASTSLGATLGYVAGEVGTTCRPNSSGANRRLVAAARRCACHDATAGFDPPANARWMLTMPGDLLPRSCANDFAPYNAVFDDHGPVKDDWETAAPGARLGCRSCAPIASCRLPRRAGTGGRSRRGSARDAYGVAAADREICGWRRPSAALRRCATCSSRRLRAAPRSLPTTGPGQCRGVRRRPRHVRATAGALLFRSDPGGLGFRRRSTRPRRRAH